MKAIFSKSFTWLGACKFIRFLINEFSDFISKSRVFSRRLTFCDLTIHFIIISFLYLVMSAFSETSMPMGTIQYLAQSKKRESKWDLIFSKYRYDS